MHLIYIITHFSPSHAHIHTQVYTHTHTTIMCACMHTCTHACTHAHTHARTHAHTHAHTTCNIYHFSPFKEASFSLINFSSVSVPLPQPDLPVSFVCDEEGFTATPIPSISPSVLPSSHSQSSLSTPIPSPTPSELTTLAYSLSPSIMNCIPPSTM